MTIAIPRTPEKVSCSWNKIAPRTVAVTGSTEAIIDAREFSTCVSPSVYVRYGTTVQRTPNAMENSSMPGDDAAADTTLTGLVMNRLAIAAIRNV